MVELISTNQRAKNVGVHVILAMWYPKREANYFKKFLFEVVHQAPQNDDVRRRNVDAERNCKQSQKFHGNSLEIHVNSKNQRI